MVSGIVYRSMENHSVEKASGVSPVSDELLRACRNLDYSSSGCLQNQNESNIIKHHQTSLETINFDLSSTTGISAIETHGYFWCA